MRGPSVDGRPCSRLWRCARPGPSTPDAAPERAARGGGSEPGRETPSEKLRTTFELIEVGGHTRTRRSASRAVSYQTDRVRDDALAYKTETARTRMLRREQVARGTMLRQGASVHVVDGFDQSV